MCAWMNFWVKFKFKLKDCGFDQYNFKQALGHGYKLTWKEDF